MNEKEFLERLAKNDPPRDKKSTDLWQTKIGCLFGGWFILIFLGILIYTFFTDFPLSNTFVFSGFVLCIFFIFLGQYGMYQEQYNQLENRLGIKKSEWVYVGKCQEGFEKHKDAPIYAAVKNEHIFLCYDYASGLALLSKIPLKKLGYISCGDFRYQEEKYWGNVEYGSLLMKNIKYHRPVYQTVTKGNIDFILMWHGNNGLRNMKCIIENEHILKKVSDFISKVEIELKPLLEE